jgi:hypothetical protein
MTHTVGYVSFVTAQVTILVAVGLSGFFRVKT